jgi:hypothetical protein
MTKDEMLHICGEHQMPVLFKGDTCPWCDLMASIQEQMTFEYKRGFNDGIAAAMKPIETIGESSAKRSNGSKK